MSSPTSPSPHPSFIISGWHLSDVGFPARASAPRQVTAISMMQTVLWLHLHQQNDPPLFPAKWLLSAWCKLCYGYICTNKTTRLCSPPSDCYQHDANCAMVTFAPTKRPASVPRQVTAISMMQTVLWLHLHQQNDPPLFPAKWLLSAWCKLCYGYICTNKTTRLCSPPSDCYQHNANCAMVTFAPTKRPASVPRQVTAISMMQTVLWLHLRQQNDPPQFPAKWLLSAWCKLCYGYICTNKTTRLCSPPSDCYQHDANCAMVTFAPTKRPASVPRQVTAISMMQTVLWLHLHQQNDPPLFPAKWLLSAWCKLCYGYICANKTTRLCSPPSDCYQHDANCAMVTFAPTKRPASAPRQVTAISMMQTVLWLHLHQQKDP